MKIPFSFKCSRCEQPLVFDKENTPRDDDLVRCRECGNQFGTYAKIREAALVLAEANPDIEDS